MNDQSPHSPSPLPAGGDSYPRSERWKRARLQAGEPISFPPLPHDWETPEKLAIHRIDASLIKELAADGVISKPIVISNAVIDGDLDFKYLNFDGVLAITDSVFLGDVDFSFATFKRSAGFDRSEFKGTADFRSAGARYDFRTCYAVFHENCVFTDFAAQGVFRGEGTRFVKEANFEQAVFEKRVLFCPRNLGEPDAERRQTRFEGAAVFADAQLKGAAHFEGAHFAKTADFRRVLIGSSAHFEGFGDNVKDERGRTVEREFIPSHFGGWVRFNGARIEGTAYFRGTCFDGVADFERLWVGGHALFGPLWREGKKGIELTRFAEKAKFMAAHAGGNAEFEGATFEKEAVFELIEVERNFFFRSFYDEKYEVSYFAVAKGPVKFLGSHVKGDAEFRGARFTGEYKADGALKADFEGMRIDGSAYFTDKLFDQGVGPVIFNLPVEFVNASVNGQARFPRARFMKGANFTNFLAGGSAYFRAAQFHGKTKFVSAHLSHQARFDEATFAEQTPAAPKDKSPDADFTDLTIDGAAFFRKVKFEAPRISFRAARFKTLDLCDSEFRPRTFSRLRKRRDDVELPFYKKRFWNEPKRAGNFDMSGATYDDINVDLDSLLLSLDPYDRHSYTLLEKSHRALGKDREADLIYYDGSCRTGLELWEKADRGSKKDIPRALFSGFQRKVFRFGVRPYRLLVFSFLVLLLGVYVFSREGSIMHKDVRKRAEYPSKYPTTLDQAVNMSLRQFIPVVEIPPSPDWIPSDNELVKGTRFSFAGYATLHRLFGFILIPLGVASLTGLLRRRDRPGK